ncbi:hypothetical protein MMC13_003875 [Lambiella insularis]|nr:hypothetical protein [Lambiella insularis]
MAPKTRVRFYREFLTPALHRRFTRAAGFTLLICYAEAVIIGDKSSLLWSWFPLGLAGIRTLLLFIAGLVIFILRVAQLHFGARTAYCPFQTFSEHLIRFETLQTLACYFFSAWWFSEVYMWSVPASADLGWVAEGKYVFRLGIQKAEADPIRAYERQRLNERPIYLRSVFFMLATAQSFVHLYNDYDMVALCVGPPEPEETFDIPSHTKPPLDQLKAIVPFRLRDSVTRAVGTSIMGPFIYALGIRWIAWPWTLLVARFFWSISRDSTPPRLPPYHIWLIVRSAISGVLLLFLWELSNAVFSAYVAQAPLKNGQPLTTDSRDPNGSLLNGLKSRKEIPKTFAFWELLYISCRFNARRNTIFSEIDRGGGSTWSQILNFSLSTIQAISSRIISFQHPRSSTPAPTQQSIQKVESLPRLAVPMKNESILNNPPKPTNTREVVESNIGSIAKSFGQSPSSSSPLTPQAKRVISYARDRLLTTDQQNAMKPATVKSMLADYALQFLRTPIGAPFRQTFKRRLCAVVLGSPYSELGVIISAVDAITNLALASLMEDQFGTVNKDISLIIATFMNAIASIERIVQQMPVHWTDVDFREDDRKGRKVDEVELVLAHLRSGLRQLVQRFESYAVELGLGQGELRSARRMAGLE